MRKLIRKFASARRRQAGKSREGQDADAGEAAAFADGLDDNLDVPVESVEKAEQAVGGEPFELAAVDPETNDHAGAETLSLARQHALSVYDAAYLELALRRGATLATLDGPLRGVAKKLGVPVLPRKLPAES